MSLFGRFERYSKYSLKQITHHEHGGTAFFRNIVTWMEMLHWSWGSTHLRNVGKKLLHYAVYSPEYSDVRKTAVKNWNFVLKKQFYITSAFGSERT